MHPILNRDHLGERRRITVCSNLRLLIEAGLRVAKVEISRPDLLRTSSPGG